MRWKADHDCNHHASDRDLFINPLGMTGSIQNTQRSRNSQAKLGFNEPKSVGALITRLARK